MLLVVSFTPVLTQNVSWQWARSAGGGGDDIARSVVADAYECVYVAGSFSSPSINFGTVTLTNSGSAGSDMFLVKYDAAGNVNWARSAGGSENDCAMSVCIRDSRHIYVGGYFKSTTITFGSYTLTNSFAPNEEQFIVKYDATGAVVWAKSASGSPGNDAINALAIDPLGNVFGTGYYQGSSITFGTDTLSNTFSGTKDVFLVKLDTTGNVLWVRGSGGLANDIGNAVSADPAGNVFVGGQFDSPDLLIGTITLNNNAPGANDVFNGKYDAAGNLLWASAAGDYHHDYILSVAADGAGNFYSAGYFRSMSITFGTITMTNPWSPYGDFFLVKYDSAGSVLWAVKSIGSSSSDAITSVAPDPFGGVFITGHFQSPSITFGPNNLTNSTSNMQIYAAKYDGTTGTALWGVKVANIDHDMGKSIAANNAGFAYVAGQFMSANLTFGSTILSNASTFYNDLFIAKLDGSVGLYPMTSNEHLTVYPNPFNDMAVIKSEKEFQQAVLRVIDCYGRTVSQVSGISGRTVVFSREKLAAGVYFFRLEQDGQLIATAKMITIDF